MRAAWEDTAHLVVTAMGRSATVAGTIYLLDTQAITSQGDIVDLAKSGAITIGKHILKVLGHPHTTATRTIEHDWKAFMIIRHPYENKSVKYLSRRELGIFGHGHGKLEFLM